MSVWSDELTSACALRLSTETLSAWRDGELPSDQAQHLARHTPNCRACAERLALFDAIANELRQSRAPLPRPTLWDETRRRILAGEARHSGGGALWLDAPAMRSHLWEDEMQPLTQWGEESELRRDGRTGGSSRSTRSIRRARRLQRRWGLIGGAVAATLITALLVGLLLSRGTHGPVSAPTATAHAQTPVGTLTGSTTPDVTATAANSPWKRITGLQSAPTIAPSNPQVMYFLGASQSNPTFQRSDDGGASMTTIPFPLYNGQPIPEVSPNEITFLYVSPLNPQILLYITQISGSACPAPATLNRVSDKSSLTQQLASSYCDAQYVSADGGASWNQLALPVSGLLGAKQFITGDQPYPLRAQGGRLYALVTDLEYGSSGVPPGGRLVVSSDGGITWALADAPIAAQGLQIIDFAPAPTGSTIFAVTENPSTAQIPPYQQQPEIWRSDDSGASWVNAGAPPTIGAASATSVSGIAAGLTTSGQPFVYLVAQATKSSTALEYSEDGAVTWHAVPEADLITNMPLGTLADGGLVVRFRDNTFRAWAPGDSTWRMVAPMEPDGSQNTSYLLTTSDGLGDGHYAIFGIGLDSNNNLLVERVDLP